MPSSLPQSEASTPNKDVTGEPKKEVSILSFQLGDYQVDVMVDSAGVFKGIAQIKRRQSPGDKLGPQPAAFQDIESYYDQEEA
jgi:hypothetical protein